MKDKDIIKSITKVGTNYQRILASHIDEQVILTNHEQKIKERLRHVFSLRLTQNYSKQQAINIHKKIFNLSSATAYNDYNWAMKIYGSIDKVDAAAEKNILAEAYWNLYQKSIENGNLDAARKALDSYKSLFNLDDTNLDIDTDKLQAHQYNIRISDFSKNVIKNALSGGVIDLNITAGEAKKIIDITDTLKDE